MRAPSSASPTRTAVIVVTLLAAAWWMFDLLVLRSGTPDRLDDTWEYGVVARALLEGHGFRTPVIHPPLWGLRDATLHVPVLVHGPLVPALLAPVLAIFGAGALDRIAWLAALAALAVVPPLVRLGERCGAPAIGVAAALLWTFAPLTLHAVHHDVALPIGAALLVASLELATRPLDAGGPRALGAGMALGLAVLARHELLAALPLLALALGSGGWRLVGGAALVLAPWWIHHALAVGQPFFNLSSYLLLGYWGDRPGIGVMRDFALTPARFGPELAANLGVVAAKAVDFFPHAMKRALLAPIPALGWLALLGGAFAFFRSASRGAAILMGSLALIPVAVMTVTLYDERYLVPLLPVYALAAARGARDLAQRMPWWMHRPRAWIGVLVLVLAPASLPVMREEAAQSGRDRALLAGERAALAAAFPAGGTARLDGPEPFRPALIHSDTPDFVAWTTGIPTIWMTVQETARLPVDPGDTGLPPRPESRAVWFHPLEPAIPGATGIH